ncbi:MAG: sugar ABC transporter permease [Clostridiales bacterium]|nr:sugar ABC transporter permease [Clostridiales bacterium]
MKSKPKSDLSGYLYVLPATIFILVFALIPIIVCCVYSFHKYNLVQSMEFIGVENYVRMVDDPYIKAALKNTLVFTIIVVPLQTFLSMLIAALIAAQKQNWWNGFVKSALFIPVISSMILVGTLWRIIYNPEVGLLNQFLSIFNLPTPNWLGSKDLALLSVCVVSIWKNVGYFMVIYIAALMDIPRDLYEVARVDGASGIQQFLHITLPMLKPITYLVITLGTMWSFQVFDLVYAMTGGGPGTSTVTLVSTIYNAAFREYRMGYACAAAMLLFVIILIVSFIQRKFLNPKDDI